MNNFTCIMSKKEKLIKAVCMAYNLTEKTSYSAIASCLSRGIYYLSGYVINDSYFIDEQTEIIYDLKDLTQVSNVDKDDD